MSFYVQNVIIVLGVFSPITKGSRVLTVIWARAEATARMEAMHVAREKEAASAAAEIVAEDAQAKAAKEEAEAVVSLAITVTVAVTIHANTKIVSQFLVLGFWDKTTVICAGAISPVFSGHYPYLGISS